MRVPKVPVDATPMVDLVSQGTPRQLHPEPAAETAHSVGPYQPRVGFLDQGGLLGMR
jgi:hypothetical protein